MALRRHPIAKTLLALLTGATLAACGGSDRDAGGGATAEARDVPAAIDGTPPAGTGKEAAKARSRKRAGERTSARGGGRRASAKRSRDAAGAGRRTPSGGKAGARRDGDGPERDRRPRPAGRSNAAAIERGDQACADFRRAVEGLPEGEDELKHPERRARQLADLTDTLVQRLRSLRATGDGARALASYIELLAGQPELLRRLAEAAEREDEAAVGSLNRQISDRGAAAGRQARSFGFRVCGT